MGIMTTIFVIVITVIFITIIGFGAPGRSEFSRTVSLPKVQSLSNRTPNQRRQTIGGGAGGNPHHREPHRGGVSLSLCLPVCVCGCSLRWFRMGLGLGVFRV